MKLSILDQAPVSSNQTPQEALQATTELAQTGESLGYTRFWVAEHHALDGLASSAPEVLLGYIGANTKNIRIGSGAVLLPYYKPYKVAETFNMLATLFPGRMDIGVGRAPGGPPEASEALSDNFLQGVFSMPELVDDLIRYVDDRDDNLQASPVPPVNPEIWMLGTSGKSASSAADKGLSYCFGQFMSDAEGDEITENYRREFKPRFEGQKPHVIVTQTVFCAGTAEEAEKMAQNNLYWQILKDRRIQTKGVPSDAEIKDINLSDEEQKKIEGMKNQMITGNPGQVREALNRLKKETGADEIMIVTITHSPEDKKNSYRLIAEQCF